MTTAKSAVPPVAPDFASRLKIAGVQQSSEYYSARWAAVSKYASTLDDAEAMLDLVRALVGAPMMGKQLEGFRAALIAADSGFAEGDNAVEMAVLAGFALRARWGDPVPGDDPLGDAAALAVITWDFDGRSKGQPAAAFVADARAYRDVRALAVASSEVEPPDVSLELEEDITTIPETVEALKKIIANQEQLLKYLNESLIGQREEADVAWWVLGEYSRDLRMHIGKISAEAAPLILGKELGDLAPRLPGNPGAYAILDRMLRMRLAAGSSRRPRLRSRVTGDDAPAEQSASTLYEAVNATPREWREQWTRAALGSLRYGPLTPVLTAAATSLEVDGDDEWLPLFKKASGFGASDGQHARTQVDMARQTYDEALLVSALALARD